MSRTPFEDYAENWLRSVWADHFAAPEAARLTSTAEPDADKSPVMSGGAEPAGAAKPSPANRED